MSFPEQLAESTSWLLSIQNSDGGWGTVPGQRSTIVNTAEALYVIKRGGRDHEDSYKKAMAFIESNAFIHLDAHGPRIRYVAFALSAFCDNYFDVNHTFVQKCIRWLINARNRDNGWGHAANDEQSDLFTTFLAIWSLQHAKFPEDQLEPSYQWLLSRFTDHGWCLSSADPVSPVATAYATCCLAKSTTYARHDMVNKAKSYLLQTTHWESSEQVTAGTVWKHCVYAWVIPALAILGEDPFCTTIAEGVRAINSVYVKGGGWGEGVGQNRKTVRAQFWAVHALGTLQEAFDPGKHVLRVDAERTQGMLNAPNYITFGLHTTWATIVPAKVYQSLLIALTVMALAVLFGLHHYVAQLPDKSDPWISAVILVFVWLLIRKGSCLIPKWFSVFQKVLISITILDFMFDLSLVKLLNCVSTIGKDIYHVFCP